MKFSRRHLLIATAAAALVIVAAISAPPIAERLGGARAAELRAVAGADRTVAYAGENISFNSSRSRGDIANYTWNFSDGNSSSEPSPLHAFEVPGWYNVTLTVADRSGRTDTSVLLIGVQHPNELIENERGRYYDLRPRWLYGPYWPVGVGPNIGNPSVAVDISLENGIGSFQIEVRVHIPPTETADGLMRTIYSETVTLARESYRFNRTFSPDELPQEIHNRTSDLEAVAYIDQGTFSSIRGRVSAEFPLEGLRPGWG